MSVWTLPSLQMQKNKKKYSRLPSSAIRWCSEATRGLLLKHTVIRLWRILHFNRLDARGRCGFKAAENRKFIRCGPEQADAPWYGWRHAGFFVCLRNLGQKSTQSSHKFKSHCRIFLHFVVDSIFLFLIKRRAVSLRSAMCHQNTHEWSWREPSNLQLRSFKGTAPFLREFWCWSRVNVCCSHARTHEHTHVHAYVRSHTFTHTIPMAGTKAGRCRLDVMGGWVGEGLVGGVG